MKPRLITIPISHYGERARWALERARVDFDETHHLQMFSWVAALRNGGRKTLPVLVTRDGTLNDSPSFLPRPSSRPPPPLLSTGSAPPPVGPARVREPGVVSGPNTRCGERARWDTT